MNFAVHFDQTRKMMPLECEVKAEEVLHVGYLEPKPELVWSGIGEEGKAVSVTV